MRSNLAEVAPASGVCRTLASNLALQDSADMEAKLGANDRKAEWYLIRYQFYEDLGLHYFRACEPHTLDEFFEYCLRLVEAGGPSADLSLPAFVDLRQVELSRFKGSDFRPVVARLASLGVDLRNSPRAFVAGSAGTFGMLRIFASRAEVSGLRNEGQTLISMDAATAADWIIERLANKPTNAGELRDLLCRAERLED